MVAHRAPEILIFKKINFCTKGPSASLWILKGSQESSALPKEIQGILRIPEKSRGILRNPEKSLHSPWKLKMCGGS